MTEADLTAKRIERITNLLNHLLETKQVQVNALFNFGPQPGVLKKGPVEGTWIIEGANQNPQHKMQYAETVFTADTVFAVQVLQDRQIQVAPATILNPNGPA